MKDYLPLAVAVGLGFLWFMNRGKAPEHKPELFTAPGVALPGADTDWSGTWAGADDALIRIKGRKGQYAPDGVTLHPFTLYPDGYSAEFKCRVKGRMWHLKLVRQGERAKLSGWQEPAPRPPTVITKMTPAEREMRNLQEKLLQQQAAREVRGIDLGIFERIDRE
jgi:hypothetical protein